MTHTTITDTITIAAPLEALWRALVDPEQSGLWRGADFVTDWQAGSPLVIRRAFGLKTIEDHGSVIASVGPADVARASREAAGTEHREATNPPIEPSPDRSDRARVKPAILSYRFISSISHLPDSPESYSTVTMTLVPVATGTELAVAHTVPDPPARREKAAASGLDLSGEKHVEFYWRSTLPLLRDLVEGNKNFALDMARRAAGQ